jgi:hypothetical protein
VYLFIIAKKIKNIEPFLAVSQQSDYILEWNRKDHESKNQGEKRRNAILATILRYTPKSMKRRARLLLRLDKPPENHYYSGFNPKYFKRINLTDDFKSP